MDTESDPTNRDLALWLIAHNSSTALDPIHFIESNHRIIELKGPFKSTSLFTAGI